MSIVRDNMRDEIMPAVVGQDTAWMPRLRSGGCGFSQYQSTSRYVVSDTDKLLGKD
jgi:hypothetical protein